MKLPLLLLASLLFYTACKSTDSIQQSILLPTAKDIEKEKNRLKKVAYMNVGYFSNTKDSAAVNNPYVQEQLIKGLPIWTNRSDAYWVYFEWSLAAMPEQPVANMVLRFTQLAPDTILLQAIQPPNLEPDFKKLGPSDLEITSNCSYRVIREDKNTFRILYNKQHCRFGGDSSPLPFFDMSALLTPEALIYHTRFYNLKKELQMEYPGYRFDRIDPPLQAKQKN